MMDASLAAKIMYEWMTPLNEHNPEWYRICAAKRIMGTRIKNEDTRKYVIGAFEMLFSGWKTVHPKSM